MKLPLEYTIEMRANAEHMSPSGRLPFIRANKFIIAEVDPIVSFVNTKGITLTSHLDASQKADMRAYMSLVSNVLGNAEVHLFCFISNAVIFNPLSFFKIYRSLLNRCLFFCQKSRPRCLFKSNQNLASKNFFYFLIYIFQELIKIKSFYYPIQRVLENIL